MHHAESQQTVYAHGMCAAARQSCQQDEPCSGNHVSRGGILWILLGATHLPEAEACHQRRRRRHAPRRRSAARHSGGRSGACAGSDRSTGPSVLRAGGDDRRQQRHRLEQRSRGLRLLRRILKPLIVVVLVCVRSCASTGCSTRLSRQDTIGIALSINRPHWRSVELRSNMTSMALQPERQRHSQPNWTSQADERTVVGRAIGTWPLALPALPSSSTSRPSSWRMPVMTSGRSRSARRSAAPSGPSPGGAHGLSRSREF